MKKVKCFFGSHGWELLEKFPKIGMELEKCAHCSAKRYGEMQQPQSKWLRPSHR